MAYKYEKLIKAALGVQVYEILEKSIVKKDTASVVDIDELASAIKIVPKSVVAFLMKELPSMKEGEAKEVELPFGEKKTTMLVNKKAEDVYKGHFIEGGHIVHEFELCSIPQLAAHMLSHFEMYDETPEQIEHQESESKESSSKEDDSIRSQLLALEQKLNALMMLVTAQPVVKSERAEKLKNISKTLKKAGLMPGMPKPPSPGTKVGGNQGITMTGLHGDKTAATDSQTKVKTLSSENKNLKLPDATKQMFKQPKPPQAAKAENENQERTLVLKKSELDSICTDCGQIATSCMCFACLSKPEIKKSQTTDKVVLKFKSDWDKDAVTSLYLSIKKGK